MKSGTGDLLSGEEKRPCEERPSESVLYPFSYHYASRTAGAVLLKKR